MSEEQDKRRQTEAQVEAIETEIRENHPLCADKAGIAALKKRYENGSNFSKGVEYLESCYNGMRCVRGDGNCYYRAFLYSLCEHLKKDPEELNRVSELVMKSMDEVESLGYERFTMEMFWEEIIELLQGLANSSFAELHMTLNKENSTSDYCTWFLRVLTAAHLKSDPDRFVHFLDGDYYDIATFCSREVEPMGKECGMVQVLALAESLGIKVNIEYMDGRELVAGKLIKHEFGPETSKTVLTLLYRPGHYDILYTE